MDVGLDVGLRFLCRVDVGRMLVGGGCWGAAFGGTACGHKKRLFCWVFGFRCAFSTGDFSSLRAVEDSTR